MNDSPKTIDEILALVNALPKPLTLGCFLESLARPLAAQASNSVFSAQPAQGSRSPRIFILQDQTTLTIVPDGDGAALLEFGERRTPTYSLKGEIEFPVLTTLPPSAPYDDLMLSPNLTTCGVCHADEKPEPSVTTGRAFSSIALRTIPRDRVSLASLLDQLATCDGSLEPGRCAILDGLLGWGPVNEQEFPQEMHTFGGQ